MDNPKNEEDFDFIESLRKMGLGDLAGKSSADIEKDSRRSDPKYAAAFAFLDLAKNINRAAGDLDKKE